MAVAYAKTKFSGLEIGYGLYSFWWKKRFMMIIADVWFITENSKTIFLRCEPLPIFAVEKLNLLKVFNNIIDGWVIDADEK